LRKISTYLRTESLTLGLEPPEHEHCGCTKELQAPTLVELDLASRKHRWPEMRKLEVDFFNALIDCVTWYEQEALNIFGLPNLEQVREAVISGDEGDAGKFEITSAQVKKYKAMLSDWQYELIADRQLKQDETEDEQEAIYNYYLLTAFAIGLKRSRKQILAAAPEGIAPYLENIAIQPDYRNAYLQAIRRDGMNRVKTKLALSYRDGVLSWLRIMAREGHNPLYIAKWLHREYEGAAWYWNRLARSESVLAINASYDSWADAAGVLYDMWSAAGDACEICAAFDGQMWQRGDGPEPVLSTHPHCRCVRVAQWITEGRRINPQWTRESPYDSPYQFLHDEDGRLIRDDRGNRIIPELQGIFGRP
jgi:hypothetical protein